VREAAFDGFEPAQANRLLPDTAVFVAGRQQPSARRPKKRLAGYRVRAEGRISHLKRGYGLRRSWLRGHDGARTWVGWGLLAYNLDNLDTLAARAVQTA
jgi:Transposase DDE domain